MRRASASVRSPGRNVSHSSGRCTPTEPARAAAGAWALPTTNARPLTQLASCAPLPQLLPMKRSMPTARLPPTASGHWPQTILRNEGWPSSSIAPPDVVMCTGSDRAGVVSRNSATCAGPAALTAVTASLYELENISPVTVASCSVDSALAVVQITGASTPYAMRELAGTLVRQAIVAENAVSET